MASYLTLVTDLLKYSEKIDPTIASQAQLELALRDINDAVQFVYNRGDLSFKTAIKRDFLYVVQSPSSPAQGTPLPEDFMGFHQTGGVWIVNQAPGPPLEYMSYHEIIQLTEGIRSNDTGIPTHYGLGGPNDPDSEENQRELLLWKKPNTPDLLLKLVYQRTPPPYIDDLDDADVEIPRIPPTWHRPVILEFAKARRKLDKGADATALLASLKTSVGQMDNQEPHGREKKARRRVHPAWRRRF